MLILHFLVVVAVTSVERFAPVDSLLAQYSEGEHKYDDGSSRFTVKYRLHEPQQLQPGLTYPLLIWLHGFGEQGADNKEHLRWLDLVAQTAPHQDYYCLALQCPEGEMWSRVPGKLQPDDLLTVTVAILDRLATERPIDVDRVYVSGVSSGGTACWEMAMRYPDRWAAIAPLSAGGGDLNRLVKIKDVPVWAFYSETDSGRPTDLQETVDRLNAIGGSAALTLVNNRKLKLKHMHTPGILVDHDSWTAACEHYHLMEWLMSQRRGAASTPPGVRPLAWWNYATVAAVPLVAILIWRAARRRNAVGTRLSEQLPSEAVT